MVRHALSPVSSAVIGEGSAGGPGPRKEWSIPPPAERTLKYPRTSEDAPHTRGAKDVLAGTARTRAVEEGGVDWDLLREIRNKVVSPGISQRKVVLPGGGQSAEFAD